MEPFILFTDYIHVVLFSLYDTRLQLYINIPTTGYMYPDFNVVNVTQY